MILSDNELSRVIAREKAPQEIEIIVSLLNYVETPEKSGMIIYDYARERKYWFPFFDDKYKEIIKSDIKEGETYNDLLKRFSVLEASKIEGRLNLAKMRFTEKFGADVETELLKNHGRIVEHKFSSDKNCWRIEVFYNFVITSVGNTAKLLSPGVMQAEILAADANFNDIDGMSLVENMWEPYRHNLTQLRQHTIKIAK